MKGKLGHAAWRWLFFIEGALTMFFALIAIVMLPDFPHNTKFGFTQQEIQLAQLRMLEDVRTLPNGQERRLIRCRSERSTKTRTRTSGTSASWPHSR